MKLILKLVLLYCCRKVFVKKKEPAKGLFCGKGRGGPQKAPGRAGGCTVGGGDAKKRGQNRMGKTSERASPPRKESRLAERA